MEIKEKEIVNHICNNFNSFFPELYGCKKEYIIRDSRIDILSSFKVDLYELGIRNATEHVGLNRYIYAPVFIEVKYNENDRDLMYEMQKHIDFRDWYVNIANCYCILVVLSDKFDKYMVDYLIANDILLLKYEFTDNDLTSMTIEEYQIV